MRRTVRGGIKLKHLNASGRWRSGNVRYYFRPKGEKAVALPDLPPDHPKFLAAYAAAAGRSPTPIFSDGTIGKWVTDYMGSREFALLADATRGKPRS